MQYVCSLNESKIIPGSQEDESKVLFVSGVHDLMQVEVAFAGVELVAVSLALVQVQREVLFREKLLVLVVKGHIYFDFETVIETFC